MKVLKRFAIYGVVLVVAAQLATLAGIYYVEAPKRAFQSLLAAMASGDNAAVRRWTSDRGYKELKSLKPPANLSLQAYWVSIGRSARRHSGAILTPIPTSIFSVI